MDMMRHGLTRLTEAATAAVANAMEGSKENREVFERNGGLEILFRLLKVGDPRMQENAMTALWNLLVDSEEASVAVASRKDCMPSLVQQVLTGTQVGQELAAGAIWKVCSRDASVKDYVAVAVPGLVQLLVGGSPGAQEHAAGALRSASIGSTANKEALFRCGGIQALVAVAKGGGKAAEQACAALVNACTNSEQNQTAAAGNGAIQLLLSVLVEMQGKPQAGEMFECAATGLRNLCDNNAKVQLRLGEAGGVETLVKLLGKDDAGLDEVRMREIEYVLGALWKACGHCAENRKSLVDGGMERVRALYESDQVC